MKKILLEIAHEKLILAEAIKGEIHNLQAYAAPVYDGAIINTEETAAIIKDYVKAIGIKTAEVKILVKSSKGVIRIKDDLPVLPQREFKRMMEFQLPEILPMGIVNHNVDYRILRKSNKQVAALMAAIPKQMADNCAYTVESARLKPISLDLYRSAFITYGLKNMQEEVLFIIQYMYRLCFVWLPKTLYLIDIDVGDPVAGKSNLKNAFTSLNKCFTKIFLATEYEWVIKQLQNI